MISTGVKSVFLGFSGVTSSARPKRRHFMGYSPSYQHKARSPYPLTFKELRTRRFQVHEVINKYGPICKIVINNDLFIKHQQSQLSTGFSTEGP
jgi:hypothetical protein